MLKTWLHRYRKKSGPWSDTGAQAPLVLYNESLRCMKPFRTTSYRSTHNWGSIIIHIVNFRWNYDVDWSFNVQKINLD